MRYQTQMRQAQEEKQRQMELLNSDPYDIEAQKRIEEAIRMEAVLENMEHAMEYSVSHGSGDRKSPPGLLLIPSSDDCSPNPSAISRCCTLTSRSTGIQ